MKDIKTLQEDDVNIIDLGLNLDRENLMGSILNQGYFVIKNHGLSIDLLEDAYTKAKSFFELDLSKKIKYSHESIDQKVYSDVGYFPFRTEKAVGAKNPDLKEMYHIGAFFNKRYKRLYANNIFPKEIESFEKTFTNLFTKFDDIGDKLLHSILSEFDFRYDYFRTLTKNKNSLLRIIYYPSTQNRILGTRAAEHTGIQLLGIQPFATSEGLEIYDLRHGWCRLEIPQDLFIINIGDMLAYLLGPSVHPTLHRVEKYKDVPRFAIVHFYHADCESHLKPKLEEKTQIKVGDWLNCRLKEIGLK